jgi:hypothetical protein
MHPQLLAKWISAQSSNQTHRVAEPGNGNCLVCSLAARMDLEVGSDYGFADSWNSLGNRH